MAEKKIKIRRANPLDVVSLVKFLQKAQEEQAKDIWYSSLGPEAKQVAHVLTLVDSGFVAVAENSRKELVAAIGMSIGQDQWSDDWVMTNEWMYVLPSYRSTDVANQLYGVVETFADDSVNPKTGLGLPIIMGIMTGKNAKAKDKLMQLRGYQYGGGNFIRRPKHVEVEENDDDAADRDSAVA